MLSKIAGKIRRRIARMRISRFEAPFRKLTLEDRAWVDPICRSDTNLLPHAHFADMYLAQAAYEDTYREFCGCVLLKPWVEGDVLQLQYPFGTPQNRRRAIDEVLKLYVGQCGRVVFQGVSTDGLEDLKAQFGKRVLSVEERRDGFCYMLDLKEQIELPGGDFRNTRKKIVRFNKNFAWTYEPITAGNMAECLEVNDRWFAEHIKDEHVLEEQKMLHLALEELDALRLQGGLFRIDGKPAAIYIGTPFNDEVYLSMFMKADNSYQDIALTFTHEFFKINCRDFLYDNEEGDGGVPGLRDFKTNLHPKFMVPNYDVTVQI